MRVWTLVAVLVAAGALVAPAAADAHAVLRHSSPHADTTEQRSPSQVVFDFNEPVAAAPGAVRVFDERGGRVDAGDVLQPRRSAVGVRVTRTLKRGVYTATYRVASADGHPVAGGIAFGVRAPARAGRTGPTVAELLADQDSGPLVEGAYGAVRGLHYAALLLILGAICFSVVLWRAGAERGRWPVAWLRGAALTGLGSSLLGLPLQGLLATGLPFDRLLAGSALSGSLENDAGRAWLVRAAAWLLVCVVVWGRGAWVREHLLWAGGLAAVLVATLPYGGHATTQTPEAVLVPADAVHVVAAGTWLGGLVLLLAAFWPGRNTSSEDALRATRAFSRVAGWAIAIIVLTGSVEAWFYLGSLDALTTTYGISLLTKVALVVAIVVLGALNRARISARGATALRSAMIAEIGLAVGLLAATAVLVRTAPPKSIAEGPQARELDLGPVRVEMIIEPAALGRNDLHLYLFDRRSGRQISRVRALDVELSHEDIDRLRLSVRRKGPAHYELLGRPLPAAGTWTALVTVRLSAFDEFSGRTSFRVRRR